MEQYRFALGPQVCYISRSTIIFEFPQPEAAATFVFRDYDLIIYPFQTDQHVTETLALGCLCLL